jgi:glyoxylase-like metal-dependent hydrolase (beta-lactamase superfamily II)
MERRTLLAAGAGIALAPRLVAAQQGAPTIHRVQVGSLEVIVVSDGFAVRPDATQGLVMNASQAQVVAAMQAAGMQGPSMQNPFNVTFVRTPRGVIALDVGNAAGGAPTVAQLIPNMRAAGLDPAQVTIIAHTHFHGDHIGGLTSNDGAALYPNAQIMVPEREWAFWNDAGEESRGPEARRPAFANVRRRFAPYQGKITQFAPGATIVPGITAVASNGHAPGHTSFLIADGNQQVMVIGDAITTPAFFIVNPEWYPVFDMDPAMAVDTRKRLLDRAATDRIPIIGYHFDMPGIGRIERAGAGYRLVPATA